MTVRPLLIAFVFLSSCDALAQQNQPSIACSATEQAVLEVSHQIWVAVSSRDADCVGQTVGRRLYLHRR
jgi:hypothetical protein